MLRKESGTIFGGKMGVYAWNRGSGSTTITTAGSVTGNSDNGIYAENTTDAKDINITQTSGSIAGFRNGISTLNQEIEWLHDHHNRWQCHRNE